MHILVTCVVMVHKITKSQLQNNNYKITKWIILYFFLHIFILQIEYTTTTCTWRWTSLYSILKELRRKIIHLLLTKHVQYLKKTLYFIWTDFRGDGLGEFHTLFKKHCQYFWCTNFQCCRFQFSNCNVLQDMPHWLCNSKVLPTATTVEKSWIHPRSTHYTCNYQVMKEEQTSCF